MSANLGFTEDQKQYLEGFIAGLANKRGILLPNVAPSAQLADATAASSHDPMSIHWEALDRVTAAGGKLVPEEIAKREKHPFDIWDEMAENAAAGRFPKGL